MRGAIGLQKFSQTGSWEADVTPTVFVTMKRLLLFCCLGLFAMIGTACSEGDQDTRKRSAVPDLIPRAELFGSPSRAQARISPDGTYVSWLAPHNETLNIWVAEASNISNGEPVTQLEGRGIASHRWSRDGRFILYPMDKDGDQNDHIYAVNINSGATRDLTPEPNGVKTYIAATSRYYPTEILVAMNKRDPSQFDLYRVNIETGGQRLIAESKGYSDWLIDSSLQPRFAIIEPENGGTQLIAFDGNIELTIPIDDYINSYIAGLDATGQFVYLIDSRNRNTAALTKYDLKSGVLTVIAEDSDSDVETVLFDPVTTEPLAYSTHYMTPHWSVLKPEVSKDISYLTSELGPGFEITSRSADNQLWTIYAETSHQPGSYYLYDRDKQALTVLFSKWRHFSDYEWQAMRPLKLTARDGLSLISYLTLPAGADRDGDGRPDKAVPLVLDVHGGPWSRDRYGFDPMAQWLANRGYAVLSVNYRGSLGFGKAHLNAAIGEFAGKMHDDLIDGVDWAISEGIADPDRIAIMGGSYGGYASLVGVSFTPDKFACGIDRVGMSNLVTAIESFPPYWQPYLESDWYRFVGNPSNPEERADMLARSPISRVEDIAVPLLITQGANDPRVVKAESDQMASALTNAGKSVTYLNFPDEGHGIRKPANRLANFAITEAFLAQCLGGRKEPIGDDLANSSIEILQGGSYVGLPDSIEP